MELELICPDFEGEFCGNAVEEENNRKMRRTKEEKKRLNETPGDSMGGEIAEARNV